MVSATSSSPCFSSQRAKISSALIPSPMMQLAQMGASNAVFKRHIQGISDDVIEMARKIGKGDISRGRQAAVVIVTADKAESERLAG